MESFATLVFIDPVVTQLFPDETLAIGDDTLSGDLVLDDSGLGVNESKSDKRDGGDN